MGHGENAIVNASAPADQWRMHDFADINLKACHEASHGQIGTKLHVADQSDFYRVRLK